MTDEQQINDLLQRSFRAWGNAAAYAACYTTDCDYVSFDGNHTHGRAEVETAHEALLRGVLHGSRLVGNVETVRHLSPDIARVHATGSVLVAWRTHVPRRRLHRHDLRRDQNQRRLAIHLHSQRPHPSRHHPTPHSRPGPHRPHPRSRPAAPSTPPSTRTRPEQAPQPPLARPG